MEPIVEKEDWKPWPRYPWLWVSNMGNIRHLLLSPRKSRDHGTGRGYQVISIHDLTLIKRKPQPFFVHRIVMETWRPCLEMDKLEVNHKDFNPSNNRLSNLEWMTRTENMQHSIQAGRHEKHYRDHKVTMQRIWDEGRHPNAKLSFLQQEEIYDKHAAGATYVTLSREYGVGEACIRRNVFKTRQRRKIS